MLGQTIAEQPKVTFAELQSVQSYFGTDMDHFFDETFFVTDTDETIEVAEGL